MPFCVNEFVVCRFVFVLYGDGCIDVCVQARVSAYACVYVYRACMCFARMFA